MLHPCRFVKDIYSYTSSPHCKIIENSLLACLQKVRRKPARCAIGESVAKSGCMYKRMDSPPRPRVVGRAMAFAPS